MEQSTFEMVERSGKKTVVVGAGPVGSLAALYAATRGDEVEVYELRGGMCLTLIGICVLYVHVLDMPLVRCCLTGIMLCQISGFLFSTASSLPRFVLCLSL